MKNLINIFKRSIGSKTLVKYWKNLSPSTKNLLILSFYIFIPIVLRYLSLHFNGVFEYEKKGRWKINILCAVIETFALMFPVFVFPKLSKLFTIFISIFIYIPYYIDLCHIILFKQAITKGALMAIFDTNVSEATGFIKQFATFGTVSILLLFIFLTIITIKNIKPIERNKPFFIFEKFSFIMMLYAVCYLNIFAKDWNRHRIASVSMIYQYRDFRFELVSNNIMKKRANIKPFANITDKFKNKKTTFVIIVGESAGRMHFNLYGYERNTNPLLSKRKDIYAFSNVETPHAQTLLSLQKVLSFANEKNMDLMFSKGSIINYFKDAGFKTFWISNQESGGRHSSYQAIIAKESDFHIFNNEIMKEKGKSTLYDMDLFDYFQNALNDKADKKVIFLHLRGSHATYANNYPKEFSIFGKGETYKQDRINAYDNSIIYNDFVINSFIDELKKQNQISYLLYFSDHGEDAGDTENSCFCHHDGIRTKPMLRIPLVLWLSPEYKKNCELNISTEDLEKPYNTENLIHTIIKLSGLSNPDFEADKSLL
ncbi:MAG: phosphoethanolamine transferase [bacterium]|nr:phosphoethanolamine transferase [bacterium]